MALRSPLVILSWLIGSSVHTWHLIISLAMYLQCTAVIVHALYIKFNVSGLIIEGYFQNDTL